MKAAILILGIVLLAVKAQAAVVRYVIPGAGSTGCFNGSTNYHPASNTCSGVTDQTVYTTIAGGLAVTASSDTLYIRAGTYGERITTIPNGSVSGSTTIAGFPGETVILNPNLGGTSEIVSFPSSPQKSYITLENITFDGTNALYSVNFDSADHITMRALTVHHTRNNGYSGRFTQSLWTGGKCYDNGIGNPGDTNPYGYCIYMTGNNNIVEGMEIYHQTGFGIQNYGTDQTDISNNIYRNNWFHDNGRNFGNAGLYVGNGSNNQVYGNIFSNETTSDQHVGIYSGATTTGIYNNTILTAGGNCIVVLGRVVDGLPVASSASIQNNICVGAIVAHTGGTLLANDHNYFGNPGLTANYHLLSSASTVINQGVTIASIPATDKDGTLRSVPWDIGAYEAIISTPSPVLVAQYSFDENSGTIVHDTSGNNNDGTFSTGVTWATGKYNSGLLFDGTGGITIQPSSSLGDFHNGFSLMGWAQPSSILENQIVITQNSTTQGGGYIYLFSSLNGACDLGPNDHSLVGGYNGTKACNSPPLTLGAMTHMAVTYDPAGMVTLYRNGQAVSQKASGGPLSINSEGSIQIGASMFGEFFRGIIDEVRIYNGPIPESSGQNTCINAPSIQRDLACPINTSVPVAARGLTIGGSGSVSVGLGGAFILGN